MKCKKIKVDSEKLVKAIAGLHNLFNDLTPSMFDKLCKGITESDLVTKRQQVILLDLIELLEEGIGRDSRLIPMVTPFKWHSGYIIKNLKLGENDGTDNNN